MLDHSLSEVDFNSAFDFMDRDSTLRIVARNGMPPKLLRLIKAYYASIQMKVRARGGG